MGNINDPMPGSTVCTWHVIIVGQVSVEEDPVMSVTDVGRIISDHHCVAWTIMSHPLKPRPHLKIR